MCRLVILFLYMMISLIILIVSGAGFAYFATQNTAHVSINLFNYALVNVPIYVVVLAALLIGILICWIISVFGSISTSITIFGKNSKIKKDSQDIEALKKQVHDLELENTRLKAKSS